MVKAGESPVFSSFLQYLGSSYLNYLLSNVSSGVDLRVNEQDMASWNHQCVSDCAEPTARIYYSRLCMIIWYQRWSCSFNSCTTPRRLQGHRNRNLRATIRVLTHHHYMEHHRQWCQRWAWNARSSVRWQYQWLHICWSSLLVPSICVDLYSELLTSRIWALTGWQNRSQPTRKDTWCSIWWDPPCRGSWKLQDWWSGQWSRKRYW